MLTIVFFKKSQKLPNKQKKIQKLPVNESKTVRQDCKFQQKQEKIFALATRNSSKKHCLYNIAFMLYMPFWFQPPLSLWRVNRTYNPRLTLRVISGYQTMAHWSCQDAGTVRVSTSVRQSIKVGRCWAIPSIWSLLVSYQYLIIIY